MDFAKRRYFEVMKWNYKKTREFSFHIFLPLIFIALKINMSQSLECFPLNGYNKESSYKLVVENFGDTRFLKSAFN